MAMAPARSTDTTAGVVVLPRLDDVLIDVEAPPIPGRYPGSGHRNEPRSELATTVAMLREMGMKYWLLEAEKELAQADAGA